MNQRLKGNRAVFFNMIKAVKWSDSMRRTEPEHPRLKPPLEQDRKLLEEQVQRLADEKTCEKLGHLRPLVHDAGVFECVTCGKSLSVAPDWEMAFVPVV